MPGLQLFIIACQTDIHVDSERLGAGCLAARALQHLELTGPSPFEVRGRLGIQFTVQNCSMLCSGAVFVAVRKEISSSAVRATGMSVNPLSHGGLLSSNRHRELHTYSIRARYSRGLYASCSTLCPARATFGTAIWPRRQQVSPNGTGESRLSPAAQELLVKRPQASARRTSHRHSSARLRNKVTHCPKLSSRGAEMTPKTSNGTQNNQIVNTEELLSNMGGPYVA